MFTDAQKADCVLEWMRLKGVAMTRENYLCIAYFGNPPEELGPEEEAALPEQFQESAESDL